MLIYVSLMFHSELNLDYSETINIDNKDETINIKKSGGNPP